ncbi:Mitochondrial distribution and morphology protein 34 [Fusarium ambrosium]|uniref:Mitochondrial distribution and morphology protein 34 n=1 Tax=Fusarium ambrosium TaxID=131363 RepID=A0A428TUW1_9HYPO|nr:Mitochondrial distribution and morphology protein 34 [Fusarium ambrosium]
MAFNFNWSPLTADADFYRRARDLLTKALNKSPKPPIIVDDILVSEFNLGTVPPDLEILEIGDLAEDRFRGIFKMTYSGDAFLTLKTRVQANPLNTYLYSKPTFTSPQPLAAASGLTIPLSITLSEIKLSAFIILVFSKQKGLTLVFRNDPLESLKVSSTFDSIQFVRDYLQRTIEQQLRNLMMDELPAIIHRLSLQLWCPDQANRGTETPKETEDEAGVDPLASPPLDPVDADGNLLDPNAISELTLNGSGEVKSLFSQKNLLRLAALTDSHRTLSLFTPGIRDVVFRAWTGHDNRSEAPTPSIATPSLTKTYSFPAGTSTTYTFSDTGSTMHGHLPARPSLVNLNSATTGLSLGPGSRSRAGRKKKTRVVNLRQTKSEAVTPETISEASETGSINIPISEPALDDSVPEESNGSVIAEAPTPAKVRFRSVQETGHPPLMADFQKSLQMEPLLVSAQTPEPQDFAPAAATTSTKAGKDKAFVLENQSTSSENSSVILEQAWIMKMAGEIAKRVYDEKNRQRGNWEEREDMPPPAYEAATR